MTTRPIYNHVTNRSAHLSEQKQNLFRLGFGRDNQMLLDHLCPSFIEYSIENKHLPQFLRNGIRIQAKHEGLSGHRHGNKRLIVDLTIYENTKV